MNLFSIPPHVGFLDAVATEWLRLPEPDRGLILLPTRRSARALSDAFLRSRGGAPMLLPRITAIGALDEAPLALVGALDSAPAIEPARRLAALSKLILAMKGAGGAPKTADRAWALAAELAMLLDDAAYAGVDLRTALHGAADEAYAAHWERTLAFLRIVTEAWPAFLAEEGASDVAVHQTALLEAQARAWEDSPPAEPVWVAGVVSAMPATARLLLAAARLPGGRVILPGLDAAMPEELWETLPHSHPQAGFSHMLAALGATRGDVRDWPETASSVPSGRAATMARALLPAAGLGAWREAGLAASGLQRLSPTDQQEEAAAIALVLRGALEQPHARAALVTPDRELAQRVAAELLRYGVVADDSAGEKLSDTPQAAFLRLIARALDEDLAPVPLLSVLKHPLAAAGLPSFACRAAARALERHALRGPRPMPGLAGLRHRLDASHDRAASDLVARMERCLEPWMRMRASVAAPPSEMLAALIEAAEALASAPDEPGSQRLWTGEEGEALAERLTHALDALRLLPDQNPSVLPGLLDALLEGAVVRSRRALRGREGAEHPRVFIWGLLEARLQTADVIVLGGLVEGVWPPATDPGPWMSRPMRERMGLASPEARIGQAAHDFVSAACAAPVAVLSCPRRRDGAPAAPARWLTRLETMLGGLQAHPAAAWAAMLDRPVAVAATQPPKPRPAVHLRPRRLSVTQVETWLRDPYAIYAKHVLRLSPLDPLDQETDASDYGKLVHAALHEATQNPAWPASGSRPLRQAMLREIGRAQLRPALQAWWEPRLHRIADWATAAEQARRPASAERTSEVGGEWRIASLDFVLKGRADRIERRTDGRLAIVDYKTGSPPTAKDVDAGRAPQLLLEAAMAAAGAFGPAFAHPAGELAYWKLSGGFEAGEEMPLFRSDIAKIDAAVEQARAGLFELIERYDDPGRAYLSHPWPAHAPRFSDYAQLARVAEWAAAADLEDFPA